MGRLLASLKRREGSGSLKENKTLFTEEEGEGGDNVTRYIKFKQSERGKRSRFICRHRRSLYSPLFEIENMQIFRWASTKRVAAADADAGISMDMGEGEAGRWGFPPPSRCLLDPIPL